MKYFQILSLAAFLCLVGGPQVWALPTSADHVVHTSYGPIYGRAAPNRTAVSEYLGIPYASPPLGSLRFAPPVKNEQKGPINATAFGYDCPVRVSTDLIPPGLALNAVRILDINGQVGNSMSEDCLTLNVWTKPNVGERKKAVMVWVYGGAFSQGNSNNVATDGQYIADDEDVVVVTFNYRENIFGFPGLPGFEQNVGLLDQRLAIEWVRDNIESFGGDPSRITLFGQSGGAASVDIYSYAWTKDPIVNGLIIESGTVTLFGAPVANNSAAWHNVSATLGCGGAESGASASIDCLRTKEYKEILNALPLSTGLSAGLGIFKPTIDEKVVFSDYPQRGANANFIRKPYLIGNNNYEAGLFKTTAIVANLTVPEILWDIFNLVLFTCPESTLAANHFRSGAPMWRYRWFGDFPNLRLLPDSGSYHTAEISVVWGTSEDFSGEPDTALERAVSAYTMTAWGQFAKDPEKGLFDYGWPMYDPADETLIRLAYQNQTTASFTLPIRYDYACPEINGLLSDPRIAGITAGNPLSAGNITIPPALAQLLSNSSAV